MDNKPKIHIFIVAAGKGLRMQSDVPKQYMFIAGKVLLRHSVEAALGWFEGAHVRVVIHPDHRGLYESAVAGLDLAEPIVGGDTRQDSVRNALESINAADEDIVLVHDAARPFAARADVVRLLEHRAASLAVAVRDSLRKGQAVVERDGLWAMQTPQAFRYGDLVRAHEAAGDGATDDASLMNALGVDVALVEGSPMNFKITTHDDLVMAEALMASNYETRTGMGFDVHAFEGAPSDRKLMLCGIEVAHDLALAGHSDADVGLHTITDALLGAIGEGDIGQHFPPSDDSYKDMDSAIFLDKAAAMMRAKGGEIVNIDVTLICEAPKIGPHGAAMKTRIADICGIDEARVNVKATTTERLGFTGRKEGIAAQAVVNVKMVNV